MNIIHALSYNVKGFNSDTYSGAYVLIPGLGQFVKNRPGWGSFFLGAFAASASATYKQYQNYKEQFAGYSNFYFMREELLNCLLKSLEDDYYMFPVEDTPKLVFLLVKFFDDI